MPNDQEEKLHKLLDSIGLWEVDKIRIRYISDDWVQFKCDKKVCNGPSEVRNVFRTIWDRISRRSFDQKVETELKQFVSMLKKRNEEILRMRRKEEHLRSLL